MKYIRYELYFRTFIDDNKGHVDSITTERYKKLEDALSRQKILNRGLKYKGYTDRTYVIVKVTREYL